MATSNNIHWPRHHPWVLGEPRASASGGWALTGAAHGTGRVWEEKVPWDVSALLTPLPSHKV